MRIEETMQKKGFALPKPSARQKSSLRDLFRRNGHPLFATLSDGDDRKETLLRKASETAGHAAGFGLQSKGFDPPTPPIRVL